MENIPFADIKVGRQYQYEEKRYAAATVTILDKEVEQQSDGYSYIGFKIRVDDVIFGPVGAGEEFDVGGTTNPNLQHYVEVWFRPVGSQTEYVTREMMDKLLKREDKPA